MPRESSRQRDSANAKRTPAPQKPYLLIGSGPLTATVWKTGSAESANTYRFNIVRTNGVTGRVTQRFSPADLGHFPKLIQLLAETLADDGCLPRRQRRALATWARALASVMNVADAGSEELPPGDVQFP